MRVWGRLNGVWTEVSTGTSGDNQAVYVTWLAQVLKLNLGESPFWGNWGIPQYQTVMTQIFPNYYVMQVQTQFNALFASLNIIAVAGPAPVYNVNLTTMTGSSLFLQVAT